MSNKTAFIRLLVSFYLMSAYHLNVSGKNITNFLPKRKKRTHCSFKTITLTARACSGVLACYVNEEGQV